MSDQSSEDPRTRLDEYLDGLLDDDARRAVERALHDDAGLRAELERARRFRHALEGLAPATASEREAVGQLLAAVRRDRARRRTLGLAAGLAAAAAVALAFLLPWGAGEEPGARDPDLRTIVADWSAFGRRLGAMAEARREGRVPRVGLGDLETPPARAQGLVFRAALERLGVEVDAAVRPRVERLVAEHFERARRLGTGLDAEARRTESALELYRTLRVEAGGAVADAWYDVYRPGLADLSTARRVPAGALAHVVRDRLDPERSARYLARYEESLRLLHRRYGAEKVAHVIDRLAPADRRTYWRDASQEGVGRDAVLAIRAALYRAAAESGADHLFLGT